MKPAREHATNNAQTYFVTSETWERRALFRTESWARLFFKVLLLHRGKVYLLHEFVLMPDHFHLLISPSTALERAVQLIKGGFSYQAKKELGSSAEIWQRGFADHRTRNFEDYDKHVHYIHLNPVKKRLCAVPADYKYSSAYPGWRLDPIPQGLKPAITGRAYGTAEAVPFQSKNRACGEEIEGVPFQSRDRACGEEIEAVPYQSRDRACGEEIEADSFQREKRMDVIPQGLKPTAIGVECGTAKAVAFQDLNQSSRRIGKEI